MLTVAAGQAIPVELAALDVATALPYTGGATVRVLLRDQTAGEFWTGSAWQAAEPTSFDTLILATHQGNGIFAATVSATATRTRGGRILRAQLATTFDEGAEVLVSETETISVSVAPAPQVMLPGAGSVWGSHVTPGAETAGSIVARVQESLLDPRGTRYRPAAILARCGEAVEALARLGCFSRTDVFLPAGGVETFSFFAETMLPLSVEWDGRPLVQGNEPSLAAMYGQTWPSWTGFPGYYLLGRQTIRLVPAPVDAAASMTWTAGAPPISEAAGLGLMGEDHLCIRHSSGALWHFLPGDGTTSDGHAVRRSLRVRYLYVPAKPGGEDLIPRRYAAALEAYAVSRLLRFSIDPRERQIQAVAEEDWKRAREELVGDAVSMQAAGGVNPQSLVGGW